MFIDKEERKTNKKNANSERSILSKSALLFYSHLPFNMQFWLFLLENIQSEYTSLFKFRFLGFSIPFLKIFCSC